MLKVEDVARLAASEDLVLIEFYPMGGYLIGEDWGTNLPDDELVPGLIRAYGRGGPSSSPMFGREPFPTLEAARDEIVRRGTEDIGRREPEPPPRPPL